VAVAEHRDAGLDFDQALFRCRKMKTALEQEAGNGLHMSAAQPGPRREGAHLLVRLAGRLRSSHALILTRSWELFSTEFLMPIFEYVCKECRHEFEALVFGAQKAECPKCQSKKLEQQLSVFAVSAHGGTSARAAMPAGPCGSCGDARGPGACSMKDFN